MEISCAFAPSLATPDHVALAEELGFERAWIYDSPALYPDVWVTLDRCAARTSRIGLGPGVLVPSLRHPMVTASAVAGLAERAPGRVAVAIGSGFTGRLTLGQRPMRWADVGRYVEAVRNLLHGDEVEWDGALIRMMHPPGFGRPRPVDVPILIGADGPKGLQVAAEVGDGVLSAGFAQPDARDLVPWRALLSFGTVLDDGEELTSSRVLDALAPTTPVLYHSTYERGGADAVDELPGGRTWREAIEAVPPEQRHFAIHEGHLVAANPRDRESLPELLPMAAALLLVGSPAGVRARAREREDEGVTEIVYQPAGPRIGDELRRFAGALIGTR